MLTLISDVHGKHDKYIKICEENEYTLQIGDLGYSYEALKLIDPNNHKFFSGNHDQHDICYNLPHCLGRFGTSSLGGVDFFFVSGAFSIDKEIRKHRYEIGYWPKTWFENEELSYQEGLQCTELYGKIKPDILISHDAPRFWANEIGNPDVLKNFGFDPETFTTQTSELLNQLFEIHTPKLFFCGHFHISRKKKYKGCEMRVLKELETFRL